MLVSPRSLHGMIRSLRTVHLCLLPGARGRDTGNVAWIGPWLAALLASRNRGTLKWLVYDGKSHANG